MGLISTIIILSLITTGLWLTGCYGVMKLMDKKGWF